MVILGLGLLFVWASEDLAQCLTSHCNQQFIYGHIVSVNFISGYLEEYRPMFTKFKTAVFQLSCLDYFVVSFFLSFLLVSIKQGHETLLLQTAIQKTETCGITSSKNFVVHDIKKELFLFCI